MVKGKWIKGTEDLREVYHIRTEVFIKEQGIPAEIEMDDADREADHVLIYDGEQAAATGRMLVKEGKVTLGRVAVLKEYRGKGLGDLAVRMILFKAFESGADEVHIHAQRTVEEFYKKLGFTPYGETFMEAGIEHIAMVAREMP